MYNKNNHVKELENFNKKKSISCTRSSLKMLKVRNNIYYIIIYITVHKIMIHNYVIEK